MRRLVRLLSEADRSARKPGALGWVAALAAGVFVGGPVSRVFIGFGDEPWVLLMAGALGAIAFFFTTLGALVAIRTKSTLAAVGITFASNVFPPAIVCLPTIYGVIFSIPAGLIAFAIVLPLVLLVRWSNASARPGHRERETLLGAAFLTAVTGGLVFFELGGETYAGGSVLDPVPMLACGLAALALTIYALGRDAARLWLVIRLREGREAGMRIDHAGRIERILSVGAGPLRTAPTAEAQGRVLPSPIRIACGAVLLGMGGVALVVGSAL